MTLEQLRSGRADDQQRDALGPVGEVLQEREHRLVGPVQVLEHEHGGVLLGDVLQEPSPGREQLLALGGGGRLDPEQRQQPLAEPRALGPLGQDELELATGRCGAVGLQDPGVRLQDLPERPERDPFPVRQAPALAPGDQVRELADGGAQLRHDARLADPRLAHHEDELRRVRGPGLVEHALQDREVDLAPDERRVVRPGEVGADPRARGLGPEDAHRLGLALQGRGFQLLVVEDGRGRLVGAESHRHPHLGGDRLQARGGVHRVSREEALARACSDPQPHERLARVDPDAELQRHVPDRGQILRGLADPQTRSHRAFGVILVRGGHAEHPDHRIADELLDDATEGLDLFARRREILREHLVDVFGIGRLRGRGEPDEVAEQRRDDLAFLGHGTGRRHELRAALAAELLPVGVFGAAGGAGRHRSSEA